MSHSVLLHCITSHSRRGQKHCLYHRGVRQTKFHSSAILCLYQLINAHTCSMFTLLGIFLVPDFGPKTLRHAIITTTWNSSVESQVLILKFRVSMHHAGVHGCNRIIALGKTPQNGTPAPKCTSIYCKWLSINLDPVKIIGSIHLQLLTYM